MQTLAGKVAVITGAGSGIGRALAQLLAEEGCDLALADINEANLQRTADELSRHGRRISCHTLDVADRAAVYAFADDVLNQHGSAYLIINNAGVAVSQRIAELSYSDFEWIMGINFWGVVHGTKAFLPHLLQNNAGHIVNVSSIFGIISMPSQGAYNASKFAVRGFTEALRQELCSSKVVACCVHPGGIKTNIARAARFYQGINGQRDADRAAAFPPIAHGAMEHAPEINSLLLIDRLEHWDGKSSNGQAWEATGWVGGNINRLWLRTDGERSRGRTESSSLEALYGRSVSPWWDVLVGVRQDFRPSDSRTWAAIGIQGLAPYKFESSATLYMGSGGQVLAKAEVEYDVLLTNRLILQPLLEATVAAKDEQEYGIGRGLNKVEAGLRLRYEFSRRFAPYIGISHERSFGDTADYAGDHARDTRWVAGVRMWF